MQCGGAEVAKRPQAGRDPKPAVDCSQRDPSALPPAGWFEGELKLVLTITLEQVCHSPTHEPGERDTVFLGQRRQLLIVPFVDADRDPCG
jgi:hypothetical protein